MSASSKFTVDPSVIYTPPTLDDLPGDVLPDPEGFVFGSESYDHSEINYAEDNDYDDGGYEPDFDYGFND